jgi:hypothetical protein
MASPYYTKQPVYLEDPSGRFDNILSNKRDLGPAVVGPSMTIPGKPEGPHNRYTSPSQTYDLGSSPGETRSNFEIHGPTRLNFPYTPTTSIINSANYGEYVTTHSNFQQRAFESHTNMEINITAPMIVRSVEEAEYVFNAALWIRSTMKMSWMKDKDPGMPPPILRFNAHGIYENVPCVIRDFTWNLDSDIDYLEIQDPTTINNDTGETLSLSKMKTMRIPVSNMFVLTLQVTHSPKSIRENFSVKDYLSGNLKDQGYV